MIYLAYSLMLRKWDSMSIELEPRMNASSMTDSFVTDEVKCPECKCTLAEAVYSVVSRDIKYLRCLKCGHIW